MEKHSSLKCAHVMVVRVSEISDWCGLMGTAFIKVVMKLGRSKKCLVVVERYIPPHLEWRYIFVNVVMENGFKICKACPHV